MAAGSNELPVTELGELGLGGVLCTGDDTGLKAALEEDDDESLSEDDDDESLSEDDDDESLSEDDDDDERPGDPSSRDFGLAGDIRVAAISSVLSSISEPSLGVTTEGVVGGNAGLSS